MRTAYLVALMLILTTSTTMAESRQWTDSSGTYKVEARLVKVSTKVDGTTVHLRRQDGKNVEVSLNQLSDADQQYIKEYLEELNKKKKINRSSAADKERELMLGTWKKNLNNIFQSQQEKRDETTFTFKADSLEWNEWSKDGAQVTYSLNPSKNPKEIDIVVSLPQIGEVKFPGIYKLEGDTLTLVLTIDLGTGGSRPKYFNQTNVNRYVLKRVPADRVVSSK